MCLQVTHPDRLWGWMSQFFVPNIYAGFWYNGQREEEEVYFGNKKSILLGMPRMRQLRVKTSESALRRMYNVQHYVWSPQTTF